MPSEEQPLIDTISGDESREAWHARSRKLLRPLVFAAMLLFVILIVKWPGHKSPPPPDPGLWTGLADRGELVDAVADPCDDFYQHACGSFLKQTLPKDRDTWLFTFNGVRERVAQKLESLLSRDKGQAGQLYASCIDEAAIDRAGTAPLAPYLTQVHSISSNTSLVKSVVDLCLINAKPFFLWTVGADADSTEQVLYMQQGGLTLPDWTYYTLATMEPKRLAMRQFVTKVLEMTGMAPEAAEKSARAVMEVEGELARMHLTSADERGAKSLPPLQVDQVVKGMHVHGGFEWGEFFQLIGVPQSGKVVRVIDVDFFSKLCSFLAKRSPESLRDYVRWRYLDTLMGHLGQGFQEEDLRFRRALFGVKADPRRERLCLHTLNLFVPGTVGAMYLSEEPGGEPRRGLVEWMLEKLRERLGRVIASAEWMTEQARSVALVKLKGMLLEAGGPRHAKQLPFDTEGKGWFDNSVSIARHLALHQLAKIGTRQERDDWGEELGAMSVNAFYNVHSNVLFVPAALMQRPFFEGGGGDMGIGVADWAELGGLMGHEMSHGFDNVGRLFGPDLVIKSWWDPVTTSNYRSRSQCVASHYATYTSGGGAVRGNATLEEDIADMAGLKIAFDAMRSTGRGGGEADRNFLQAWAQTWCSLSTKKELGYALRGDPHAPDKVRVNAALSSFQPFAEAYNCPVGSKMRPVANPCTVW